MIYFNEEASVDYGRYRFGYSSWGIPENDGDIQTLYAKGYLPYSDNEKPLPVYYLCRSLRVSLSAFAQSSENRRVIRKISEVGIVPVIKKISAGESLADENLITFFLNYFSTRHGEGVMSRERIISLFEYSQHVYVTTYSHGDILLGAVISQEVGTVVHYWFSAYSLEHPNLPIGMWLMLDFIESQKNRETEHVYLGTGYGQKALYKTNIEQLEYWNGQSWVKDHKTLKSLMNS